MADTGPLTKQAYRERLKDVHPDQGGSNEGFHRLQEAKEVLLDG